MAARTLVFLRLLGLASCFGLALGAARYIAIPIDGVDVIELSPIGQSQLPGSGPSGVGPRLARQTPEAPATGPGHPYVPLALSALHHAETADRPERAAATAHILDYVDFGAHTGPNGAFSWYADYPAHR